MSVESEPAGFARRLAALCYDSLLLAALIFATAAAALALNGGEPVAAGWLRIAYLLVPYAFYTWFWTHGGQTLGMRAWRLKLVSGHGNALDLRHASVRFAAALLSLGALGLGFAWILFSPRKLAWHDSLSDTRVIVSGRTPQ